MSLTGLRPNALRFIKVLSIVLAVLLLVIWPMAEAGDAQAESLHFNGQETGTRLVPGQQVSQNRPPEFSHFKNNRSVAENLPNGSPVGEPVSAVDPDGDSLYYALTNGDLDMFTIDSQTGQLRTKAPLDYENKPEDDYWLHVAVRDGKGPGGWTDLVADDVGLIVITVENADEPGTVTLDRLQPQVGTPLTATLSDPDGNVSMESWQWAQSNSPNSGYTNISGVTSETYTPVSADYDKYLRVTVTYTDAQGSGKNAQGGGSSLRRVRATPQSNSLPTFSEGDTATRSIAENTLPGVNVGNAVSATDSDQLDLLRYKLAGTGASSFSINPSTGMIKTKAPLDYDAKSSHSVMVKVMDPSSDPNDGDTYNTINVNINVTDEPVEIHGPSRVDFSEGNYPDSPVVAKYTIQPSSAELTLTGPDARHFSIAAYSGLTFNEQPDYEAPGDSGRNNVYNVTINAAADIDGTTHRATKNVRVKVTNYN